MSQMGFTVATYAELLLSSCTIVTYTHICILYIMYILLAMGPQPNSNGL